MTAGMSQFSSVQSIALYAPLNVRVDDDEVYEANVKFWIPTTVWDLNSTLILKLLRIFVFDYAAGFVLTSTRLWLAGVLAPEWLEAATV